MVMSKYIDNLYCKGTDQSEGSTGPESWTPLHELSLWLVAPAEENKGWLGRTWGKARKVWLFPGTQDPLRAQESHLPSFAPYDLVLFLPIF